MCRKLALAATALSLIAGSALAAPRSATPPAGPTAAAQPAKPAPPPPAKATPEQRAEADRMDPLARAAFWSHETGVDPRDGAASVKLAKALRDLGRYDEAAGEADRILVIDPSNEEALLEEARARIAQGQAFFAIDPAQRAAGLSPRDWRPVSLMAVALELSQRDDEALAAHQHALALAPNNPAVMSNLAMYYAAHGQSAEAEQLLRRAAVQPGATAQVRQNLALILGLNGRLAEAEQLQRRDLPPAVVDNNLAYLKAAQSQTPQRSWDALKTQP